MLNKKNIIIHFLSLCALCVGFILCRYVFFDTHGMKQFPELLFAVGVAVVVMSFFLKGRVSPLCVSVAYILGFIAGAIFQSDSIDAGGAATNNLWIIWAVVFVCLTLIGIIGEIFVGFAKKNRELI